MINSIEWNCEEAMIRLMKVDERLSSYSFVRHDNEGRAKVETFVLKGTKKDKLYEGNEPYDVTVEIVFASAELSEKELDRITDAMAESIYSPNLERLPSFEGLTFLFIESDSDSIREDTKKLRKRGLRVRMLAK